MMKFAGKLLCKKQVKQCQGVDIEEGAKNDKKKPIGREGEPC